MVATARFYDSGRIEINMHPYQYKGYCCLCNSLVTYEALATMPKRDRRHNDCLYTAHPSLSYTGTKCLGRIIPVRGKQVFRRVPVPYLWDTSVDRTYYRAGYEHGYRGLVEVAWMRPKVAYQQGYALGTEDRIADRDVRQ